MDETITREEYFIDWLPRISEKLQFILLNIKENRDITDEDYDFLRVLHKIWHYGEFPLYRQELVLKDEKSEEQGLFGQNDTQKGTARKLRGQGVKTKKK